MGAQPLSDEILQKAVDAFREHGTQSKAAAALNMPRPTLQCQLERAAARGLMGTKPVLPGFVIKQTSTQRGPTGELQREWIQQAKAPGEEFKVPDGHTIKGISALIGPDGRELAKWVKTKETGVDPKAFVEELEKHFAEFKPSAVQRPLASHKYDDQLTLYPFADPHYGLLSWHRDTGQNWDLKHAVAIMESTFARVIARTPPTKHAILLVGGDILHSQNHENTTARSGHALQVDGRFPKVLLTACESIVRIADLIAANHETLEIIAIPGNHDPEAAYAVQFFLHAWYRNEPRVSVDLDTSLFRIREYGAVMLATTHGHTIRAAQMPEVMAAREPEIWGRTRARFIHTFHVHHKSKPVDTVGGCTVETHEIMAPQDDWHFNKGFLSGRSQKSITYHKERGMIGSVTESIY